jgi:hypothetical protein
MKEPLTPLHDTYFALLEKPELRQIGLARYHIEHRTPFFSQNVYSASAGIDFGSETEAYAHWLAVGRREGHEWAPGRDTLLKIVLKAKDEPYLIDAWVAHHAAIVGYENLIILDCGSQDPAYLEKLNAYASRILILDYRCYYDHIHATRSNADFFGLLAANCRYLTILDADEFLLARMGELFSGQFVKPVLRARNLPMFCGIWVTATAGADGLANACGIDVSPGMLSSGAVAGKAVARHDVVFDIGHLGHNLHVAEVLPFVGTEAFGELLVLHLKNLPREMMRERVLQHLVAKGVVGATAGPEREARITALAEAPDAPPAVIGYAQGYLGLAREPAARVSDYIVTATLINAISAQALPALATALAELDWAALLEERRARLGRAA